MSSFNTVRRLSWDTETTGVDPTEARIVTAALIGRGGVSDDHVQTWLINPGIPIPPETTGVHGITDAVVQADGQDPKAALEEIGGILARAITYGMPLVAFNTAYDWTVLHCELERHGLRTVADRISDTVPTLVDPHVIDKQVDKYVKGSGIRRLKPTAERYGVELTDWHTAEADALAALLIAEEQFVRYPVLDGYSPAQLFAAQRAWRAEQQAGLQHWFRTKATAEQGGAPDKVIDGSWPLIPAQRGGDV
jgi:DNA polymerase III subunit epsilon